MLSKYRKILCQDRILAYQTLENSSQEPAQLTIFDGINFISEAWKQVEVETIKHSWEKTKIISDDNQGSIIIDSNNQPEIDEINNLISQLPIENPLNADEFIMIDQNLEFEEEMTVQEIVNVVLGQPEVEDNEDVDKISEPIVTNTEAINGLENALKYIQQKDLEVDSQIIKNILRLKREISYRSTQEARQCRIDEFMSQQ